VTKAIEVLRGVLDPETLPNEWVLERVRNWRNAELIKSDWTQVDDSPVDKAAWAIYRQALRDLPASNADPQQIELPAQPGGN
jgi:hypothetical protein